MRKCDETFVGFFTVRCSLYCVVNVCQRQMVCPRPHQTDVHAYAMFIIMYLSPSAAGRALWEAAVAAFLVKNRELSNEISLQQTSQYVSDCTRALSKKQLTKVNVVLVSE